MDRSKRRDGAQVHSRPALATQPSPESQQIESRALLDLLLYGIVIFGIALAFQGSRGLFEPDEGRYADAALDMLRKGDWLVPRLQGLAYLDKPPALYWSIAAGFKALGVNEWGARVGQALALASTALLVATWSGRAWGTRIGRLSGAAYVTSLLPPLAANALTPDTLLALWTTAAAYSYWRWRDARRRWLWALLLGVATGLALLTKGAAALVFLAPVVLHALWESGPRRLVLRAELWASVLVAAAIGLSWYAELATTIPGAAGYFFENQIAGRLWSDSYHRNPQWWAPVKVYAPVLVLGSLPWSLTWLSLALPAQRRRLLGHLWKDPLNRFLLLSAVLPLIVFCLAKSKLPLYILPLFPSLVMLTISQASRRTGFRWSRRVLIAAAVVILIKAAASFAPAKRDTRALAKALRLGGVAANECIDALETKVHGLSLYGYPNSSWHTIWPESYPYFETPSTLMTDLPTLLDQCGGRVRFLVDTKKRLAARGLLAGPAQLICKEAPVFGELMLFSCTASLDLRPAAESS